LLSTSGVSCFWACSRLAQFVGPPPLYCNRNFFVFIPPHGLIPLSPNVVPPFSRDFLFAPVFLVFLGFLDAIAHDLLCPPPPSPFSPYEETRPTAACLQTTPPLRITYSLFLSFPPLYFRFFPFFPPPLPSPLYSLSSPSAPFPFFALPSPFLPPFIALPWFSPISYSCPGPFSRYTGCYLLNWRHLPSSLSCLSGAAAVRFFLYLFLFSVV